MKFKPSNKGGGVLVELSSAEAQLPTENEIDKSLDAFHLKEILVPVDFSSCSRKALQYAIPLAKQFGATISVVHVAHECIQHPELVLGEAAILDASQTALNDFVREISSSIKTQAIVRIGQPASEIVELAQELQSDLIILSTHGRSGLAHVFLGSTAEKVVRHAPGGSRKRT
jgi:nucleotide-binding universal stress UspA family protein